MGEAELRAQCLHDGEELVFAVEAAVGVVAGVLGRGRVLRWHDVERHAERSGKGAGLVEVAAGEAGGVGEDGDHAVAEDAVRGGGQKGGVDAAGVGHHEAAQLSEFWPSSRACIFCATPASPDSGAGSVAGLISTLVAMLPIIPLDEFSLNGEAWSGRSVRR